MSMCLFRVSVTENNPLLKYLFLFNGSVVIILVMSNIVVVVYKKVVIVVQSITNLVLSVNYGGGRIYLIILEIVLTPNLHLK